VAGDDEDGVCDVYRFLDDYVDMLSEKVFSEDDIRKELINVGIQRTYSKGASLLK
jgi:hypothetical protein